MSNTKVSGLTFLTGANVDETADVIPIVDTSVTTTKKILVNQLALAIETKGANVASASAPDIWAVGQSLHITGTTTLTGFAAAPRAGIWRKLIFDGACLLTHAGATFVVQGGANYTTAAGDMVLVYADTTTKFYLFILKADGTPVVRSGITLLSAQAATSGTEVSFTGWPTGLRRVTVMFNGVSTNGTTNIIVQLATSLGFDASGYLGTVSNQSGSVTANFSTGFIISLNVTASLVHHGKLVLNLENSSNNTWSGLGTIGLSGVAGLRVCAGTKALADALYGLRIYAGGTDTFDAGDISVSYE